MKTALLSIVAWLAGAVTYLALIGDLKPIVLTGTRGAVLMICFAAITPVLALFFGVSMFQIRRRGFNQTLRGSSLTGAALGTVPGILWGLFAQAVRSVDRSPEPLIQYLFSAWGLSGVAAGIVAGAVFGAGFWALFVRRRP